MNTEKRIVWIAALVQFVNIVDFMIVMPLGPDIAKVLPVSNADIGMICGCYTLAVAFSGLIMARFLDRFDRKTVAIVAVAGLSLATLSAAFAWDLTSLIGARVLAGCFGGPAAAISLSMVTDAVPPERRGRAMATVMAAFAVSSIVAIPLGLELARLGSWRTPFYSICVLGLLVLILLIKLTPAMRGHLDHNKGKAISISSLVSKKENILAFMMMGAAMVSSFLIIPNISAYFQFNMDYPRSLLGMLYLVGGVFSLLMIQLGGCLTDKIGPLGVNYIGTIVLIFFLYDGFMHPPFSPLIVIFVLFMGTVWIRNISAMTEASKLPAPHERAAFMAILSSVQHFSNGIGALLSSAMLTTQVDGSLIGMDKVAALAIAMALFQPFFLTKIHVLRRPV